MLDDIPDAKALKLRTIKLSDVAALDEKRNVNKHRIYLHFFLRKPDFLESRPLGSQKHIDKALHRRLKTKKLPFWIYTLIQTFLALTYW